MEKNTGKVREKSGNFVSPEKWEPWQGVYPLPFVFVTCMQWNPQIHLWSTYLQISIDEARARERMLWVLAMCRAFAYGSFVINEVSFTSNLTITVSVKVTVKVCSHRMIPSLSPSCWCMAPWIFLMDTVTGRMGCIPIFAHHRNVYDGIAWCEWAFEVKHGSNGDGHFDGQNGCWRIAALCQSRTHLIFDVSIDSGLNTDTDAWCECCNSNLGIP